MADNSIKSQEEILKEYEEEADNIIHKMMNVLVRVQRKIDDAKYRRILEQLQKEKI